MIEKQVRMERRADEFKQVIVQFKVVQVSKMEKIEDRITFML